MDAVFGVHFGSTSACLAVCKDGKSEVVANEAGDRVTPAIVAYTDHEVTAGLPAKQGIIRNASNTVSCVKQLIGRGFDDEEVQNYISDSPVNVINKSGTPCFEVEYKGDTKTFTPQEVATRILKNIHDIAARQVGNDETYESVITVPIEFTEKQRRAVCEAAEEAGFNVLRVISESSAAILAYDVGQDNIQDSCNVVVYKLGGQSVNVTVVKVVAGMYQILSSVSSHAISGKDFTESLVQHFVTEFNRQWKCDCRENKRSIRKLHSAAETCKHVLSTVQTSQCSVDSLYDGIDFQCSISRGRFEGLCGILVQNCLRPLDEALHQAGLTRMQIDKVVMCGGSAKMPMVQSRLSSYFSSAEILSSLTPDEVIAIGAAKQAGILVGRNYEESQENEKDNQLPCLSQDILVKVNEEENTKCEIALPQWTPVPTRKSYTFKLLPEQTSVSLHVLSGNNENAVSIAKVTLREVCAGAEIHTVFHVKGDGSLQVTCTDSSSKKSQSVTVEAS